MLVQKFLAIASDIASVFPTINVLTLYGPRNEHITPPPGEAAQMYYMSLVLRVIADLYARDG